MIKMVFLEVDMGIEHTVKVPASVSVAELVAKIREYNEKYILVDIEMGADSDE